MVWASDRHLGCRGQRSGCCDRGRKQDREDDQKPDRLSALHPLTFRLKEPGRRKRRRNPTPDSCLKLPMPSPPPLTYRRDRITLPRGLPPAVARRACPVAKEEGDRPGGVRRRSTRLVASQAVERLQGPICRNFYGSDGDRSRTLHTARSRSESEPGQPLARLMPSTLTRQRHPVDLVDEFRLLIDRTLS